MTTLTAIANEDFTSLAMKVIDRDPAGISGIGTDFAFDFTQGAAFVGERPADTLAVSGGVVTLVITQAGIGGTDGTYDLVFSGGGGSGAAGSAVVSGGVITSVTLLAPGSGYTAAPTASIVGSNLISYVVTPAIAVLQNLARDAAPFLGRTGKVRAVLQSSTARPTRDGPGLKFAPTTRAGLRITKEGVAANRVCEPALEGFLDHLILITFRAAAFASGASPFMCGESSGTNQTVGWVQKGATGDFQIRPGPLAVSGWTSGVQIGALTQLGILTRYDTVADTTSHYAIRDGLFRDIPIVGRAPTVLGTNITGGEVRIGGGGTSGPGVFNGTIYSVYRELVGVAGLTNAQVANKAARAWAYAQNTYA